MSPALISVFALFQFLGVYPSAVSGFTIFQEIGISFFPSNDGMPSGDILFIDAQNIAVVPTDGDSVEIEFHLFRGFFLVAN